MTSYNPLFDATAVDTPAGMTPAVALGSISGVPSEGTGLAGEVYITNGSISSITVLENIIATRSPVSTFTATELLYSGRNSDTTVGEFLGDDAASIQGVPGDVFEMGPSGMTFTGYVYIPEGVHEIAVNSDDGFSLKIGGVDFSEFAGTRGTDETARVADFAGGLYQIELLYFDAGGGQSLNLEIDGITVNQSAFYQSTSDFTNPPADVPVVPVADYHPSYFLEAALDIATSDVPTDGADSIEGGGADETIDGGAGDDFINGGYGDDKIIGGDGDDVLLGGRGADLLIGGDGDDLLIGRSDANEQRIGQLALGTPTRPDTPEGDVNQDRQKLKGYEDQPLISDDVMIGGAGSDVFMINPLINAKLHIIQKHTRSDGTINWAGVAGENTYLHDHWVDHFGIETIADYVAGEDQIAVIGHTATIGNIDYRDVDGDGDIESIITVVSNQHGGGGAHDDDLLGHLIVHGDMVEEDDIITDAGVTYGIVETYAEVAEAIFPEGDLKVTEINGELVYGYDTRDALGNLGPITGSPEDYVDNPYMENAAAHGIEFGAPSEPSLNETRYPFEQLGTVSVAGQTDSGTPGDDVIAPVHAEPAGLPGALGYYSFTDTGAADGAYEDARGGPTAKAYTIYENRALLRTDGLTTGPDGSTMNALEFNGEDEFAFIKHDPVMSVTQGTISIWVRPDDLSDDSTFLSKDQSGRDLGGHFRLGHTSDGQLFMRFADGNGRWGNNAWETITPVFTEGEWAHVAVNFTATGITVFVDGNPISDIVWQELDGGVATPGIFTEGFILQNENPWVLGADSYRSDVNSTAQIFAVDDEDLDRAFDGAVAEFGVWGGFTPEDALSQAEINELIANGPGAALTNPSGPQPMLAGDDVFEGGDGDDLIFGEAGNDTLDGGAGNDSIEGGYGDDWIEGGSGNDELDGGRGNDILFGGDGDDLLWARSDGGEQRAGQLVLDDPSRPLGNQIDLEYLKLADWIDQPIEADDVLVGGAGNDTFYIQTLINGTKDILLEHTQEDRSIRYHGVAGENTYVHDHWVDLSGIDVIADFKRGEDEIKIIGHTTNILDITHKSYDSDGDGVHDDAMSIVQIYSQQGNGGGAHDEDMIGYAVVFGDLVTEDDIQTDAGAHFGIVRTVDDIQEAVAPTGETKISVTDDGVTIFGYDSRDIEGNPMAADPLSFSSNPFLDQVDFASSKTGGPLTVIVENDGGTFDGVDDAVTIPHTQDQAQLEGTWAFSFTAETPGDGRQVMLSKDHSGYKGGGHLSFYVESNDYFYARFQGESETRHLRFSDEKIQAGESYHIAFTFTADTIALYVNGEMVDAEEGFPEGMLGNIEDAVIGASTMQRWNDDDRLRDFFDGTVEQITVFDRAIDPVEAVLLASTGGDHSILTSDVDDQTGATMPVADIVGDDGDNRLFGDAGNNIMDGGAGHDRLYGRAGDDTMIGGTGNDVFYVDEAGDMVMEHAAGGYDRVYASLHHELDANVEAAVASGTGDVNLTGNAEANWLTGNAGSNVILGGDGNDRLQGRDGEDTIDGGEGNDMLEGGAGADLFRFGANGGLDRVLDFEVGIDLLEFEGASFADVVIEDTSAGAKISYDASNAGNNVILAGISAAAVTVSSFAGSAQVIAGTQGADRLYGTDGDDVMEGGAGNDSFYARLGADLMIGGTGDDRYYVDNAGDQMVERAGEGYDRALGSVDFTLGAHVEAGSVNGDGAVNITGNDQDNHIRGSLASNVLLGEGGRDRLYGMDGDDTLDGGADNDILEGGTGADVFRFGLGGGSDLIMDFEIGVDRIDLTPTGQAFTDIDIYDSSNGAVVRYQNEGGEVALVILKGVTSPEIDFSSFVGGEAFIVGTDGNDVLTGTNDDDILQGLAGNDRLDGRGGVDEMIGGTGDDSFYLRQIGDTAVELAGEGYDRAYAYVDTVLSENIEALQAGGSASIALMGNDMNNVITGNSGNNVLRGGAGNDRVQGAAGNDLIEGGEGSDVLFGGDGADIFRFSRGDGTNQILDFQQGVDRIDFSAINTRFNSLDIYDSANGVVARWDDNPDSLGLVIINGLTASDLSSSDFTF
ncbi:MAG: LamG-like jellyroll fold domain-containing protein [Pseudomonadota bacterium]